MNKRQVISVSCVAAIPAAGLLAFLIMNALAHGGNMSGVMGVFVAICALLALLVGIAPFLMLVWYPAEGFASAMPEAAPPESVPQTDEDDFEADGFDDDAEEQNFDFEDDDESFDDEYEDFEDEDEDEWK